MNEKTTCLKCGSDQMIDGAYVADTLEEGVTARVARKPEAKLFKGVVGVAVESKICGRCGYIEMYAEDPAKLWEAYQEALRGP